MRHTTLTAGLAALALAQPLAGQANVRLGTGTPPVDTLDLSLAEVRQLALERNPAFLAERQESVAARGEYRQARTYNFNPAVDLQGFEPSAAGIPRQYTIGLTQEVQWAGQWGLRSDAARLNVDRADARVRDAARLSVARASRAFYATLAAQRRLDVAEQILRANERLLSATRIQLKEGEISALEANLADIEFGRGRARVLTARRELIAVLVELRVAAGISPDQPIRLRGDSLVPLPDTMAVVEDSLSALAVAQRPDIAAERAAAEQFRTLARLARRDAVPNLTVGAFVTRDDREPAPRFGLGVGLPLPLWNRNGGVAEQRDAQAEQASLRRGALELQVRGEISEAFRAFVTATEEAGALEANVIGPVRRNFALLDSAYQAGKVGLPTLLLLRNQLLDAELDYWRAWLAQREALVRLEAAIAPPHVVAPAGVSPATPRKDDQ